MGNRKSKLEDPLSITNHPASRLPGPNLLHLLVQSRSQDGVPAIDFLAEDDTHISLSYAEFHRAADALATRISAAAGRSEDLTPLIIPVLIPQSPELYITLLAILKAGAAFCPMNLDVPLERAKFILDDVSARVVITTSDLAPKLPQGDHIVLMVDFEPSDSSPAVSRHRKVGPKDLAYVMYTSGSTGTPKGVGVSHEAATQSLLAHDRHIPQFSRFLQFAAPTFDVSVFEIFFPFFRGKTLVSCTRPAMLNDLPAVIRKMDVDACELTPSVAGSLLRKRENAPGLRLLLTIGEMLTKPVVEEFGGGDDGRPSMLWGMYGPTEAAIHCTLQPAFGCDSAPSNIGIPLDTVSAFILKIPEDGNASLEFKILPLGEVGELAVGGYQLADGYLNRPEQTSSAFIDTPYGRLYRTGDKARMGSDGSLECLGRIWDGQVKLRGQRMELGEVEHAALRTEGCHSAVAAVTDGTLVLFCAVDRGGEMASEISQSCKEWLPGFMIPGDIVVVESFPRLASGKVDRKRLVAEYRARRSEVPEEIYYKDRSEQQLCELASSSLGVTIRPDQDLSKAGLDSLSAIRLASAFRDAGFELGALDVLGARSISVLYSRLQVSRPGVDSSQKISDAFELGTDDILADHPALSDAGDIETIIPCTPLQVSMLAESMANSRAYCNWVELAVPGAHSDKSVRSWISQLAQANDILRTGFAHHKGRFVQVVFKTLSESQILTTDSFVREFELQEDQDFLRPFRVRISASLEDDGTTVLLQLHHALYDGWSLDLMRSDLAKLARRQRPKHRPGFREVTAYYQSEAFRSSCDLAREFWAETLLGFQPLALPVLHPEITQRSTTLSATVTLDIIPEELKTALQSIDCGPQAIFQAAIAWLWSSMVGSEDVVVGSVTSGRTLPISKIEDVIGPCIASLPLRTNLSQVRTIRDLLVSVHAGNRATLRHSVLPLSEIKRAAGIRSGQALYDVLFIYQETLYGNGKSTNAIREIAHRDYLETKLLVEVEPQEKSFDCRFTYHSDAFPESLITVMADSIQALAHHMLANLNSEISSMRDAFSHQLLSIYNPEPTTFSGVADLASAVKHIASKFPEKDAVCFADHVSEGTLTTTTITFAELNKTADRIAWHLGQQRAHNRGIVAIVMEKSIRFYAGVLAILKTGCAYLPLLPSTPVTRIQTIFQQANVQFCLVDTATHGKLGKQLACNFLDIQSLDLESTPLTTMRIQPDADRLAYIIYTSGSTGVPKGVCLTQLNIMSNLDVLSRIYPVKEDSRLLQSCSQAFDVSVFEIFFAWTQGMCLCSGTNDTLFDDLERAIRRLHVTHLSMTPTVASLVDPIKVPRVEFLVTAGEPMTEVVAQKWGDKLYQGYGPSETTNICSVKKMGPGQAIRHLGWSFDNTSTLVLERDSTEPVPLGCLGELCFGGDQVAQGYLGMEDLTAAKFINHPTFGRIYRSGDLGRMLPDGSMVIVGRSDEQIKLRGQRIELNEITETVRQSFAKVADCATLFLRGEETGSQDQIVLYLVPVQHEGLHFQVLDVNDELKLEIQSVYQVLCSRVPAYMVPSAIVPISILPTTASGKLDRARLKRTFAGLGKDFLALISQGAELNTDEGEWSEVENRIAEAVSDGLELRKSDIRRWTPLATLGLDSITAIHVSRHLHRKLDRRVPISLILENTSVARLAQALNATDTPLPPPEEAPELLPKSLVDKVAGSLEVQGKVYTAILPCTPLQEAMLATSANNGQYLNRMLFRVNGDLTKLKESWNAMCARHDILRTCFVTTDHIQWPILQVVIEQWQPLWHDFDANQSTIEDCISRHAQKVPGSLDTLEPAISLGTITQDNDVYLSFVCHHALYDGVAIETLLYQVEQHFSGSLLPPVPAYDQFLRASLALPASIDGFWLQQLAGYEPKLTAHMKSEHPKTRSHTLLRELETPLSQIQTRNRELGVSLLSLTQSAWATALGSLFRTNDICFGNVVNGRSLPIEGITDLVAPCFNTIPIRMGLPSSYRNVDLMKAFQTLSADLMQYQFTPLRRIQSLLSQHGNQRLFDTLLLLQQPPRPLDQSVWTLERDEGEMDVPLVCEVTPDALTDRLVVKMHTLQSQPLSNDIVELVFDLFAHAMRACLQFPASLVAVDSMPQGLAARLSHVQLQLPQPVMVTETNGVTDDWTETESSIRTVLATFSSADMKRIQRHTSIYQLGLDSISAVQVASALRKLGHQVLASDVIEHPTCEALAHHLDTRTTDTAAATAYDLAGFQVQIQPQLSARGIAMDRVEAVLPCSPLQSAMMTQFIQSGGRDYFNYVDFALEDGVSAAKLTEAWRAVCLAHPMLHTGLLPVEHDDCAFAMVQYRPETFVPALTLASHGTFDLGKWRREVSSAAAKKTDQRLWSAAVVRAKEGATMHLAIHHALYDAHSLQVMLEDLSRAVAGGQIPQLARTEDVVVDILGQVSSATENSAEFWKKQADRVVINGFPAMTPLREPSREILTESMTSSASMSVLEEAAAKSGHTLQVVLQAAWTRVLSAYLGETSVVFGVVLSGRNTEATRNAVFPCITTLPVISTNSDSNNGLLTQMLQYNTELYKQQHQPLTRIQKWLNRPESRLFDTLLVYQKLDLDKSNNRPWCITDDNATVDYPVSIEIEPQPENLLEYRVTFFNDALTKKQALILLRQFDAQVQHLALKPGGNEADLFMSSPDLFSVLPPETPEIPTDVGFLHQFVEFQAFRAPEATALHFVERFDGDLAVGRKWTYKELDDNGNRVAQMLLPHVNPGSIIAICFDKCPAAYFSILGILKAGCAFVALDPGAPRSRNEFIINDSGALVLLASTRGTDDSTLSVSVPVLVIDEAALSSTPADPPILSRALQPSDVCYCLYTSGTTGTPKGCEITHDNAVQCMLAFQHIFRGHWQDDSKWLQFASLHFDVSVLEQYWSWSVGITLVAAPRDLILEDLAGTIARLEITHIDLTPSLARLLHPDDVPSLCRGVFITGGESLKQEILDVWGSKKVIYNFYGPTEATIGVTVYPRVPTSGRACNIGRQFVNVGSYVLKPGTEQPVLRGGVGELCVSGRLVGKGYLNRDDLTSERFPTLQHSGERVYRTGDLVRVLHDGCFDFLGRADDQVKLRGQRLEIGEINHAIRKGVEAVKDAATLVVRNEAQRKDLLVSFIVADDRGKRGAASVLEVVEGSEAAKLCRHARDACRSKLPGYMVPTYVLQLPFIPLSPNNKAEIKELRKLFASIGQDKLVALSSSPDKSPRALGSTGAKIAKVLGTMQAIDASSITPDSSIFELGIDSISVLRFARALKNEGLDQASPSLILRHPLIGDLASALEEQKPTINSKSVSAAKQLVQACAHKHRSHVCRELGATPDQIEYIAPSSPLQQGMISRSATEGAYFNTFRFVLAPNTSVDGLRKAYQCITDALPILRTKFVSTTDGFVQVAMKDLALPWSEARLEDETEAEDVIQKTRDFWIARNQGTFTQPWEAVLVDGGTLDNRSLILHIFHGLYDANSFGLILDQVAAEYLAQIDNSPHEAVSHPGPSFLDALCHGPLQDFGGSKPFWLEHLADVTAQPLSSPSVAVVTSQREVSFERLETLRTTLGVTHQAIVQAAWVSVLAKHLLAGPTVGIIVSGRAIELDGAEQVVGPLFNTLPFHARFSEGTSWSSLIRQCHDFNTAVLAFQHTPLRDIQKWCSAGQPLFGTLFSFQREERAGTKDRGLWTVADSEPNADYPLALEAVLGSDSCLRLLLVAQDDDPGKPSKMMDELEDALNTMVKDSDGPVGYRGPRLSNGESKEVVTNGHTINGDAPATEPARLGFSWTEQATLIRNEIAALADTNLESVAKTTPIFGLGLDSIDVIKLSARLKRCGINLKTSELIKAQTIEAMLQLLQEQARETEGDSRLGKMDEAKAALRKYAAELGELGEGKIVLPTTPLQDSMVLDMIESEFQLYFNHDILELGPTVDIDRLKGAWKTVISGSPILRTRFLPVDSTDFKFAYCQVIGPDSPYYMADVELGSSDELTKICDTATLRARKGAGRSDLLQLVFAGIGNQRFLVLSLAHALYDGWSLGLIHHEVQEAYEGRYTPHSLGSYLDQLNGILFPDHHDASSFWSGFLQDATPTVLPENEAKLGQESATHRAELTSSLAAPDIASFCRANAITLQTLGQACWAALLAATTNSLDVTFGVVLSCRDNESLEELVFPTMNTVAVRSVLHGTISSWLRYMQDNMASIATHQHFPLREAQRLAQTRGPLFNTLFIQQRELASSNQQGGDSWAESVGGSSAVEYPVCVEMEMLDNILTWRTACSGGYASAEETTRLLQRLDQVLGHFIRSPETDVLSFSRNEVSICGLPSVILRNQDNGATASANGHAVETPDVWSPLEETIRDVLAEISEVPATAIAKSNNIYHLGLDSISAIKAGALLRKRGVTIQFRDMLKAGSIPDMARLAMDARPSLSDIDETARRRDSAVDFTLSADADVLALLGQLGIDKSTVQVLPASPMQVHMLSVWQNTRGEVFYPEFRYTLSGKVDIATIDTAWKYLVAEIPILRTVFVPTSSRSMPFLQVVTDPSSLAQRQTSGDSSMIWESRAMGAPSQPYHRMVATKDGEDNWMLRLKIHHALYDAISLPAIMERFTALCSGANQDPACSTFRWSNVLVPLRAEDNNAARKRFWTEYLTGVESPSLCFKHGHEQQDVDSRVGLVNWTALQNVSEIVELCKARGVSLQALFFAAYAEFLASAVVERGEKRPGRVVFGIYLANRAEISNPGASVYPFLRLVPIRAVLKPEVNLLDVAAGIQEDIHVVSSPVNAEAGLWEIKDWTGITVDSFVNFLGAPVPGSSQGDVRLELVEEQGMENPAADLCDGQRECKEAPVSELADNPIGDAFPDAIDIEVSVQDDDMTIGVFGSGQRLGSSGAARIIDGIVDMLKRAV